MPRLPLATPRVAIVEPLLGGHRSEYVNLLASLIASSSKASIELFCGVTQSTSRLDTDDFAAIHFVLKDDASWRSTFRNALRTFSTVRRDFDVILLPSGDRWVPFVPLLAAASATDVRALIMRPRSRGFIKRAVARIPGRHHLYRVESPFVHPASGLDVVLDPSGVVAHGVPRLDDTLLGDRLADWCCDSGSVPTVGLFGRLDDRKCFSELARSAEVTRQFKLVAVGPSDSSAIVTSEAVFVYHNFVSDDTLAWLINQVDVLALMYRNEDGSSGLMAHAVRWGKPFCSYRNATVSQLARLGHGTVADSLDPGVIAEGILRASRIAPPELDMVALEAVCFRSWAEIATLSTSIK